MTDKNSDLLLEVWLEALQTLSSASFELLDDILSSLPVTPPLSPTDASNPLIDEPPHHALLRQASTGSLIDEDDLSDENIATTIVQLLRHIYDLSNVGEDEMDVDETNELLGANEDGSFTPKRGMFRMASGPSLALPPPYEGDGTNDSGCGTPTADRRTAKQAVLLSIIDELLSHNVPEALTSDEHAQLIKMIRTLGSMLERRRQGTAGADAGTPVTPASAEHSDREEDLPIYQELYPSETHVEVSRRIRGLNEKQRSLNRASSSSAPTISDTDPVLSAISRLSQTNTGMSSQRVELSAAKRRNLQALTTESHIERLSRGRYEGQRAQTKQMAADSLGQKIMKASQNSPMSNQRVHMDQRMTKNLEIAKLQGHLEKLSRGRYSNQEWISPDQQLQRELEKLTDHYSRSTRSSASVPLRQQRYRISVTKERDMFMNDVDKRIERLSRMSGQDASFRSRGASSDSINATTALI